MSIDCDVAKCRKNENGVFLFERAQTLPYCNQLENRGIFVEWM